MTALYDEYDCSQSSGRATVHRVRVHRATICWRSVFGEVSVGLLSGYRLN